MKARQGQVLSLTDSAQSAKNGVSESDLLRVLDDDGHADPSRDPQIAPALAKRIYQAMLRTHLLDERLFKLQRQGRIGFHIGAEGEEAAVIASAAALRDHDWIFPCYREVGAALYRGWALQHYIDNMYGNDSDVAKGRQMPDHVTCRAMRFGSVTSPIGTQISQAVGFAWASKLKKEDIVTAAYFGDGATSSNDFHAGMTFAGVYHTPNVFLLRNNGWAISLPSAQQCAARSYADKGVGYGVPAVRCDGNDALAVYATVKSAVERAVQGGGSTLVEMVTARVGGHSTSDDPAAYRNAAEVELEHKREPVGRFRRYLERQGVWSDGDEKRYSDEVVAELQACVERAEKKAPPAIETMFEQVFETMPAHLAEQQRECLEGPRSRKQH